jgi:hypothetical protein
MVRMFQLLILDAPLGNRAPAIEVPMQGEFLRNSRPVCGSAPFYSSVEHIVTAANA